MKKILLLITAVLMAAVSKADFSGAYAPSNWITTMQGVNTTASIVTSDAPSSITLNGSDDGSGDFGEVFYSYVFTSATSVSFTYTINNDDEPGYDFIDIMNGSTFLASESESGTYTASYSFNAGDTLTFGAYTDDNTFGAISVTITNFVATGAPLPIKVGNLSITKKNGNTILNWLTYSEENNKGFYIQKSGDGKAFTSIGFVPSKAQNGISKSTIAYTYADASIMNAKTYYRFYQEDKNGVKTVSNIVFVDNAAVTAIGLSLSPNPASNTISINAPEKGVISIIDIYGKVVKSSNIAASTTLYDISYLAKGVYYLSFSGSTQNSSIKFIKE